MAVTSALKPQDFRTLLARPQPLPPVILLVGPEPYFKEEALGQLADSLQKRAGSEPLNRVVLDSAAVELEGIFATHLTASLFGGEKLVVLRNFDKAKAADRKSFLKSLGQCQFPGSIHLAILSEDIKSAPPELKELKPLVVAFWVPWQSELLAWIGQQLTRRSVRASAGVAPMLYRMHGKAVPWKSDLEVDVHRLAAAIERLGRHVAGRGNVTVDEAVVTAVLGRGEPPDVFRLVELIGRRDRPAAQRAVRHFLEEVGESPLGLIALLLDRFGKLLRLNAAASNLAPSAWQDAVRKAKAVEAASRSDAKRQAGAALASCLTSLGEELQQALQDAKDYQKPSLVLQAERYSPPELVDRLTALVELDRKLKTGAADERAEVELFVARI